VHTYPCGQDCKRSREQHSTSVQVAVASLEVFCKPAGHEAAVQTQHTHANVSITVIMGFIHADTSATGYPKAVVPVNDTEGKWWCCFHTALN
jgi:hypothetical protein